MDRYQLNNALLDKIKKRRYREVSIIPTIPKTPDDIYVITTIGDRLDTLAFEYYKTVTLWWAIAAANPDIPFSSLYLEPGLQIRIPSNITVGEIGTLTSAVNKNR